MLERWRERDVFARSLAKREGAELWSFYEGPPTANGRPGSHHVLARVFKDIYPRYKTMRGYHVPRKAGWDCHGLPVELEVEKQLGISSKQEIEEYGIAEFNRALPRVGLRVRRGVEPADRADRLLDRPRRPLRDDDERLHRVGLVVAAPDLGRRPPLRGPQGRPLLPALRHRALLARGRARLQGRRGPLGLRALPAARRADEPARGRRLAARLDDDAVDADPGNVAVAVAPEVDLRRALECRRRDADPGRARWSRRCSARRRRGRSARFAGSATWPALATRPARSPTSDASSADYGHPRPAPATSSPPRTAPASSTSRRPSARTTTGRRRQRHLRPDRHHALQPGHARRHLRRPRRRLRGPLRQGRRADPRAHRRPRARAACSFASRSTSTPTRTAGAATRRCSTTRRRAGTSARPRSATSCSPTTRRSAGTPSTSSTAASASGSRTTSTGRSRASATGARRCRSGAARTADCDERDCVGSFAELRERRRRRGPRRPRTAPTSTRSTSSCAKCGGAMRRVRAVIDAWFDTGAMPFAQFHYPFENEEEFKERFPADFICEAHRPDPRLVLLAARRVDPAVRRAELPQLRLPRPDPRPRGPEDVEEHGQRGRPLGGDRRPRRRRLPLVLPHLPAALGRLPLLGRDGRRVGAPVPADALEHLLASSCCTPTPRSSARRTSRGSCRRRSAPTSTAGRSRACRRRSRPCASGSTTSTAPPPGAAIADLRRRALQLVRAALAPPLLGRATAPRFATLRDCLLEIVDAAGAVHAVRRRRDLRQPRRRRVGEPATAATRSTCPTTRRPTPR